ncbi:MAG: DUF262 domain-containing protein [Anaerolineae bacterium]|nr:DUF262 domain-containing protein [Anaerolineae bacterium]MBT7601788.1 DUF262 domain-containing protein [Anaerolineae bacterium]MBT7992026.1 DUF262 domain-containing protein [Anaerolineae bacterium]
MGRENVQEFWDDIIQGNSGDYFIGSMVVYKDGKRYWGIVDGQQRLTTITIFLCVLRDAFEEFGFRDLAEGIHGLIERKNIDNSPEFILSPQSSYPYFQDHIQKQGKPELIIEPLKEEQNLKRAYDQLNKLVAAVVYSIQIDTSIAIDRKNDSTDQRLKEIRDTILDLKLILVQLDNEDDAYLIFETLNTRGKDLRLTDLVKNHLTRLVKNESASVDQTKIKWEEILRIIESSDTDISTDTFLYHFWLSRYEFMSAKKIFKSLKKKVGKDNAPAFLDELLENASFYRSIHEPSYGKWSKEERRAEKALQALMLFKVRQQIPSVLALVRAYKNNTIRKAQLEKALVFIEKFHFSFSAVTSQRSSGGISAMYASFARQLSTADDREQAVLLIQGLKRKLGDKVPSLDEFKALFPEIIYTDNVSKQKRLVRYILEGFHKDIEKAKTTDYSQMTIEHILPQKEIKNGIADEIIGQLGNMILIPAELNDELKDKSFRKKKAILANANVPLSETLQNATKWDENSIKQRTLEMAEQAYTRLWRI